MDSTRSTKRIPLWTSITILVALGAVGVYFNTQATADSTSSNDASTAANRAGDAAQSDEEEEKKAPIPVRTRAVTAGTVSAYISATANLVAENEVRVVAESDGRLAKLAVDEGQRVSRGQVLAALDRTDGEIGLEKARARSAEAAQRHARMKNLADQELISHEAYEKTRLDDQVAKQELAEAEWMLEKTLIRAPFAGRVTERMVQLGQHVRPGDELFTVTDFDSLVARVFLPEKDVLGLDEGRAVRITLKADERIAVEGRIRHISSVVDTATGTVKVTVEARQPGREVRPGAFVRVDVVRETRSAALLVPREAIVRELQKAFVFVAADGVASKRRVDLGIEENERIEATSGVAAGDQVIVAGQGGLEDGAPIKLLDLTEDDTETAVRVAALD